MNIDIIGALDVPFSPFDRASFFWRRCLNVIPLKLHSLKPALVENDWRRTQMELEDVTSTFRDDLYEVGLGTYDGVIVVEASQPITGWLHRELGAPFALTERFGLYSSFYWFDGFEFENPLPSPLEYPIRIHYRGVVLAPGTPQPGRKTLFLRNGGTQFKPWWVRELQREAVAWRQARRQALAIHGSGKRAG